MITSKFTINDFNIPLLEIYSDKFIYKMSAFQNANNDINIDFDINIFDKDDEELLYSAILKNITPDSARYIKIHYVILDTDKEMPFFLRLSDMYLLLIKIIKDYGIPIDSNIDPEIMQAIQDDLEDLTFSDSKKLSLIKENNLN